jgi:hypothetical protein
VPLSTCACVSSATILSLFTSVFFSTLTYLLYDFVVIYVIHSFNRKNLVVSSLPLIIV